MKKIEPDFALTPIDIPNVYDVRNIRWIESEDKPFLFSSVTNQDNYTQTIISSTAMDQPDPITTSIFNIRQLLPPHPHWDVRFDEDNSCQVVLQEFGGAINKLIIKKSKGEDVFVSQKHPHESFREPRFFKQRPDDIFPSIIAVAEEETIVVFVPNASGEYGNYIELGEGIFFAVIKPYRDGHMMFYKIWKPGMVRGPNIPHGNLKYTILKADLKPTENMGILFGDRNFFEFDVAVFNDQYAIAATTDEGFVFAVGTFSEDQGFKWQVLAEKNNKNELIRPTVIAFIDRIYFAFIELLPEGKQRILTDSIFNKKY